MKFRKFFNSLVRKDIKPCHNSTIVHVAFSVVGILKNFHHFIESLLLNEAITCLINYLFSSCIIKVAYQTCIKRDKGFIVFNEMTSKWEVFRESALRVWSAYRKRTP